MERRDFVESLGLGALGLAPGAAARGEAAGGIPAAAPREAAPEGLGDDRSYWVATATRIARPVVENLARGELKKRLPVQEGREDRQKYAALEAFGRTLTGLAPWLELPADATAEGKLRAEWAALARRGLAHAVDPSSPDFMNFTDGSQPLVDAAFLALALLRAPSLRPQDSSVRANLLKALRATRSIKPGYSNWLLFSGMVEALFLELGEEWDAMRVDLSLRTCAEWYVGDSFFKDGPDYHHDYYNSFVIQPFMWTMLQTLRARGVTGYERLHGLLEQTGPRHAEVLERGISPEGAFPLYGRSIVYRFGAFHLLAQIALERRLAAPLTPPSVRCALTTVLPAQHLRSRHFRRRRMAPSRFRRSSAVARRALHLSRQPVPLLRGLPAAGSAGHRSVLGGAGRGLDGQAGLGRRGHEGGPRPGALPALEHTNAAESSRRHFRL